MSPSDSDSYPNLKPRPILTTRPSIVTLAGKTYVCPGWHEVPEGTTLADVEKYIEVKVPAPPVQVEREEDARTWQVLSSAGDGSSYTVTMVAGVGDDDEAVYVCTCAGFSYRRKCRHITEVKDGRWEEEMKEEEGGK